MRFRRYVCLALLAATAVLAFGAAGANSSSIAPKSHVVTASADKVGVKYTIKKFVRRGHSLVAYGTATAKYYQSSGAVRSSQPKRFVAAVAFRGGRHLAAAQRICPVLDLTLAPLDLNLLGLMIHLDRVHLTITADSNGGVLGSLLCGLSNNRLQAVTQQLNWVVEHSGLSTGGLTVTASVQAAGSGGTGTSPNAVTPLVICQVLDLSLGPLHLDLLGLIIDLNRVHLTITADSEGGILGSLLCGLAGGG